MFVGNQPLAAGLASGTKKLKLFGGLKFHTPLGRPILIPALDPACLCPRSKALQIINDNDFVVRVGRLGWRWRVGLRTMRFILLEVMRDGRAPVDHPR